MTLQKRYVVGTLMALPMLPVVLLGFVVYWVWLYGSGGWDLGELVHKCIEEKVND